MSLLFTGDYIWPAKPLQVRSWVSRPIRSGRRYQTPTRSAIDGRCHCGIIAVDRVGAFLGAFNELMLEALDPHRKQASSVSYDKYPCEQFLSAALARGPLVRRRALQLAAQSDPEL
jgi:hypothetical protein